jgi:hypothetical protein
MVDVYRPGRGAATAARLHRTAMRALPLAAVLASLSLAACGAGSGICDCGDTQVCVRGRCFDNVCEPVPVRASALPPCAGGSFAGCAQALGTFTVGTTVPFTVEAGASSLTIQLQAAGPVAPLVRLREGSRTIALPNTALPLTVTAPDGTVWFDDRAPRPADASSALVFVPELSASPVVGSLTLPNTTRGLELAAAGLPAGTWRLVVSDYAHQCSLPELDAVCGAGAGLSPDPDLGAFRAGRYDLTVLVEPGPPAAPGARVDVAFYLQRCAGAEVDEGGACATPLTAATAPADPDVQRMVLTFGQLLANGGVALGEVLYRDLPDAAQARWARGLDLDANACDAQLGQLLALSEPGDRMNLFLLPAIVASLDGETDTVGIDGTIPGPAGLGGTVQSGAVVSGADLRARRAPDSCAGGFSASCGADFTAYIAAHETGHFLGLYHTTEATGATFDPVADTPICECAACGGDACGTPDATVSTQDCRGPLATCGGGENLMFWVFGQGSLGTLTPQQGAILRASPLVR